MGGVLVWIYAFPKTPTLGLLPLSCSLRHLVPSNFGWAEE